VNEISEAAKLFKGPCPVKLQVIDEEERMQVDLPMRKYRVDVKEFALAMEKYDEIRVKVS
jgi:hypothetical protein